MSAVRIIKLAGAVVFAGVAGTIYYIIRKKLDTGWGTEEVVVPADAVGRFIGRKGANVKLIEAKTQTKIHFKDFTNNGGNNRVCVIRGPVDRLWLARSLVEQSVQKLCVDSTVQHVDVPAEMTGGIIGARGHRINEIMHSTGTRITVEQKGDTATQFSRRVEVRGRPEGVKAAVCQLQDRVQILQLAKTRRNVTPAAPFRALCSNSSQDFTHHSSMLHPENSSSDVYVCSVASATSLYVQLVSPKLVDLNTMVEEMTSFYSQAANRQPISSKRQGIVAAPYPFDNRWYRAWQLGPSVEGVATRLKKRSNPSGSASTTHHNYFQKNNEGAQNGCHSLFSTNEINDCSGSQSVSSVHSYVHTPNVERNTPTQGNQSSNQCDSSLKPEAKSKSGNVDLKNNSSIELRDLIQTGSARSDTVACDDTSSELVDNNHNTNHSKLTTSHNNGTINQDDVVSEPSVAGEQDVWHTPVFFVDYGDYALVPLADLCDLRTDFLSISHQAFLVHLAGVVPVANRSLQAQYHLSNFTRCSEWQPITAKIVGYLHNSPTFDVVNGSVKRTDLHSLDKLSHTNDNNSETLIETKLDVLHSMLKEIVSEETDYDDKEEDLDYDSFRDYDTIEKKLFDSLQTLSNLTLELRLRESLLVLSQVDQNQNRSDAEQEQLSKLVASTNELRLHLHPNSDQGSSDNEGKLGEQEAQDSPAIIAELTKNIALVKKKHHLYQLLQRVLCCGGADLKCIGAGGGPIPLVKLFVHVDGKEMDVAEQMVSKGLLQRIESLTQ